MKIPFQSPITLRLQNEESVDIKEDLPKDVSNELTNHNNISPLSNNSNTNWNNDTWADGEFEPINEDTFTGNNLMSIHFIREDPIALHFIFVLL